MDGGSSEELKKRKMVIDEELIDMLRARKSSTINDLRYSLHAGARVQLQGRYKTPELHAGDE
jgi:hypothetical protein